MSKNSPHIQYNREGVKGAPLEGKNELTAFRFTKCRRVLLGPHLPTWVSEGKGFRENPPLALTLSELSVGWGHLGQNKSFMSLLL